MNKIFKLGAMGLILAGATWAATINPYTDSASFNSAISGYNSNQTENFNGSSSIFYNFNYVGSSTGLGISGGVFNDKVSTSAGQTTTFSRQDGLSMYAVGALWDLTPGDIGQGVVITLNLTGGGTQTLTYVLGVNQGNYNGSFYFGFTSSAAFDSFTLSGGSNGGYLAESFNLDNLTTASTNEEEPPPPTVPEPSTFGLVGAAMLGLGLFRRARR